jgi:hypothetical protein
MGYDTPGRQAPLIDQIHRLMQLWREGNLSEVEKYITLRNLKKNALFHQLLQAIIELSGDNEEERVLLESISNHLGVRRETIKKKKPALHIENNTVKLKKGEDHNE